VLGKRREAQIAVALQREEQRAGQDEQGQRDETADGEWMRRFVGHCRHCAAGQRGKASFLPKSVRSPSREVDPGQSS